MKASTPTGWTRVEVQDLIEEHYCGPSPTCEERPIRDEKEWGLLKTTAITWEAGWDWRQHKVPPRVYWHRPEIEVHSGDVLVTKAGPRHRVGVVCEVPETPPRLMVSGKMIGLRPSTIVPAMLAGALSTAAAQKFLDQRTTGMAESQVNFSNLTLLATPLNIPPLPEQRRIAAILDTLDEAIRRTAQVTAKLQKMKQGLLHDLLTRGADEHGDLRPPAGEAPQLYKDSPLGPIPAEWNLVPLEHCLSCPPKNGYSPTATEEWTGRVMLGLGCLTPGGFRPTSLKNAPRDDPKLKQAVLCDGDLLMSRSNTRDLVGLVGTYRDVGVPCSYPDLMMKLVANDCTVPDFLEVVLRTARSRRQLQAAAVGTSGTMLKINGSIVRHLLVPLLPREEQATILTKIAAVNSAVSAEQEQSVKLCHLKRGLLHDLLTGRVRVPLPAEASV